MTRLETIATRQRKTIIRDAVFATCVALAAIISVSTVGAAVHGSHVAVLPR
jgi:hypothetical protein